MLLIEIKNGVPTNKIDFLDFRKLHPNVSFPEPLDSASLVYEFGFAVYELKDAPDASTAERYYKFVEDPVLRDDGICEQKWKQDTMTDQEKLVADGIKLLEVSEKRSKLLSESDWTQLSDVSILNKQDWATYRQSLRVIATQPGYPWAVEWPTAPSP
jgi:hypothetical protein